MSSSSVVHETFTIRQKFKSEPERVFAYFSDPAKKRQWLGGEEEGFTIDSYEPCFQVDGFERWRFRFDQGPIILNNTCYINIVANRRIVFVYSMTFGGTVASASQVTIELLRTGSGTELIHTEQGAYFDGVDQPKGREDGTRAMITKLAELVDGSGAYKGRS